MDYHRAIHFSLLDTTAGNEAVAHEAATQAATEIELDVANFPRLASTINGRLANNRWPAMKMQSKEHKSG